MNCQPPSNGILWMEFLFIGLNAITLIFVIGNTCMTVDKLKIIEENCNTIMQRTRITDNEVYKLLENSKKELELVKQLLEKSNEELVVVKKLPNPLVVVKKSRNYRELEEQ